MTEGMNLVNADTGEIVERAPAPTVDDIMLAAVQGGTIENVEILERLVGLKERQDAKDAERAMFEALADLQSSVPPIKKTKSVSYATRGGGRAVGYSYAPLDAIANAIRGPLRDRGLAYTFDSETEGGRLRATCTVRHIAGGTLTASFECEIDSSAKMSGPQKTAAANTYAKRQALIQALGLTTTEDDIDAKTSSSGEPITGEQAATLEEWIETSGADRARFLKFLGVSSLDELDAKRYDGALANLKAKAANR